ncbi:MAG: sulfatase-like hydrolase/transferase, partial [Xanthomonadales bacterium]|nr:sulfatase-like hydrolase/transferase [Xanthomonadales bacterium]NIX12921.1 sulfatase-like hydrolase/transferase [Xanthomonadales bacterium]
PYGSEVATPNLDTLADEGMVFNQFRNTSKCFPTRAALMTGQYAQRVGMSVRNLSFRNYVTLGDVLRTAGYHTLMVGKHHALDNPYDMGFDHYWGMRDGAANHFNPGYQREGEAFPAHKRQNQRVFCFDARCMQPFTPESKDYYTTDTFTDWAIELLGRHEESNDEQPFFLYLSYTAPHDPIQAWPKDIAKYEGRYDEGYAPIAEARYARQLELGIIDAETHPRTEPTHRDWDSLSLEEKADESRVMAVYSAMIDSLDQNLGRLFGHLEETGELDDTLIMFLSDNGASAEVVEIGDGEIGAIDRWASIDGHWANVSNVPFKSYKNSSFEGGVVTPFIARWPGVVTAGGPVNQTSAHLVDIMATVVDISGATYPEASRGEAVGPMDGVSLLPAFRSGTVERGKPVFLEWRGGRAVIDGHWKLVMQELRPQDIETGLWDFSTQEWELYDLGTDRTEINNLARSHPDKVAELVAKYEAWWAEVEPVIVYPGE